MVPSPRFNLGPYSIWTKAHTSNKIFFPFTAAMKTDNIVAVRLAMEMGQSSGDVKAIFAYQLSNDGISWDSATEVTTDPTSLNDNGFMVDAAFRSLSIASKLYIRFGVNVCNVSGSTRDLANLAMRLDIKNC